MFKVELHQTLNSVGSLIAIGLSALSFYYARGQAELAREQAKENIVFRATIEEGDFKSNISKNNEGDVFITLQYNVLIANLSNTSTSAVDVKAFYFTRGVGHTGVGYTEYATSSDPLNEPIYLTAGKAANIKLNVRVPLSAECYDGLKEFGGVTSFSEIIKVLQKKRSPDCLLMNIFEPYSQAGFDSTFDPIAKQHVSTTYHFLPPITFLLKTAGGKNYSNAESGFSVNFRGGDVRVMPR